MKKIILFLIILILSLLLAACKSEYDDLTDMKCDACGGEYHYKTTVNFLDDTQYYYVCDICGKEIRTRIWRGK